MPIEALTTSTRHRIMRAVRVVSGSLTGELSCRPAFDYARDRHSVEVSAAGATFRGTQLTLSLFSSVPVAADGRGGVGATLNLGQGESAYFVLENAAADHTGPPDYSPDIYQEALRETKQYWRNWLRQCQYRGRWREMVHRSALVLKLLTYAPTGAIVAAPTTSLPEAIGGDRNWDYRFTWLRDSALTLHSLLLLGFTHEAEAFGEWLLARLQQWGESDGALPPMYTINGGRDMPETELDHLEGYRRSRPVRVGNGAYQRHQARRVRRTAGRGGGCSAPQGNPLPGLALRSTPHRLAEPALAGARRGNLGSAGRAEGFRALPADVLGCL